MFANDFLRTCKRVIEEPGLIERLKDEHFDVYITENFDICGIGKFRLFAIFYENIDSTRTRYRPESSDWIFIHISIRISFRRIRSWSSSELSAE